MDQFYVSSAKAGSCHHAPLTEAEKEGASPGQRCYDQGMARTDMHSMESAVSFGLVRDSIHSLQKCLHLQTSKRAGRANPWIREQSEAEAFQGSTEPFVQLPKLFSPSLSLSLDSWDVNTAPCTVSLLPHICTRDAEIPLTELP